MGINLALRAASAVAIITFVSAVGCSDGTQPTAERITAPTSALASLTSGTGSWAFSFRITAPSGREVIRVGDVTRFQDPLIVHDLIVELRNLPLEEAGVYFVDLVIGDTPAANRRFNVQVTSEKR